VTGIALGMLHIDVFNMNLTEVNEKGEYVFSIYTYNFCNLHL
jgi:hypothetical protein